MTHHPTMSKPLYILADYKVRQYGRRQFLVYKDEGDGIEVEIASVPTYIDAVLVAESAYAAPDEMELALLPRQ